MENFEPIAVPSEFMSILILGRVEHWCSPGAALERFDARVYHEPQQSVMTRIGVKSFVESFVRLWGQVANYE